MKNHNKYFFFIFLLCLPGFSFGHSMAYDFSKMSTTDVFWEYFKLGVTHIVPLGYDHILFVIGLFLLNPKIKSVLKQITAFTIAHSITLALAMTGKSTRVQVS
ncbi:MAG: HupE/UreJ family protein [Bacteroidetes bacterium]|nr:HupE/UreJ family protein [Bacteroidota bacterium]